MCLGDGHDELATALREDRVQYSVECRWHLLPTILSYSLSNDLLPASVGVKLCGVLHDRPTIDGSTCAKVGLTWVGAATRHDLGRQRLVPIVAIAHCPLV